MPLFGALLPRHLEIIFEINRRFLDEVRARFPNDEARVARVSLINEHGEKWVRMAHLATVGSHAVNGVAALHTELLKRGVLRDFYELYPERFHNVTNGVTPRRWMAGCNPDLTQLITDAIGDAWIRDAEAHLPRLEPFADDAAFRESWRRVRRTNKVALANEIQRRAGVQVDPDSMFDVQVKRIHEYKRQHLNALHMLTRYLDLLEDAGDGRSRTVIVSGKAAPGYVAAKLIIKLITSIGDAVNHDRRLRDRLKVVFLPDFNVKNASRIYPGADLSEQISMASTEASGTGNMKFAMNGALTIGTLDGANVEIRDAVGADNFFLFGLTTEQVRATKAGRLCAARARGIERAPAPRPGPHRIGSARRAATPACSGRCSTSCSAATSTCCWPTTTPTSTASTWSTRRSRTATRGRGSRSSRSRAWAGFRPIAPSASTPKKSGARRRLRKLEPDCKANATTKTRKTRKNHRIPVSRPATSC